VLNHGLPMVFIPVSADQFVNAQCADGLGVGMVLDPADRTPEAIRGAVRAVQARAPYRTAAQQLQAAMAALPGPDYAVALLERLGTERRPLVAG
jgi:UDP:flavonoid glycosyltransferase YjiC (YdhE family)